MARLRLVKKKQRSWAWLTAAVGGFVILCGLVLLVSGPGVTCGYPRETIARKVRSALREAKQAEVALQANNYGMARASVQKVQERLSGVLNTMQASAEAGDDE